MDRRRSERLSQEKRRPPGVVPGYELERPLGEGAFGEVWVALNRNTGYRVAIKFYSHRGGLDWSLLSREVEKLRFLRADRCAVQLLEVGWNANPPYYVMDSLERGALEDQRVFEHHHAEHGWIREVGLVVRLSDTPGLNKGTSPRLGQHSTEILTELGYDDAARAALLTRVVKAAEPA